MADNPFALTETQLEVLTQNIPFFSAFIPPVGDNTMKRELASAMAQRPVKTTVDFFNDGKTLVILNDPFTGHLEGATLQTKEPDGRALTTKMTSQAEIDNFLKIEMTEYTGASPGSRLLQEDLMDHTTESVRADGSVIRLSTSGIDSGCDVQRPNGTEVSIQYSNSQLDVSAVVPGGTRLSASGIASVECPDVAGNIFTTASQPVAATRPLTKDDIDELDPHPTLPKLSLLH